MCDLGVIPPLEFPYVKEAHIEACMGLSSGAVIARHYIIRTERYVYKLSIAYNDHERTYVDHHPWRSNAEISLQYGYRHGAYRYEFADDYDLSIPRAILNTFRFIETP